MLESELIGLRQRSNMKVEITQESNGFVVKYDLTDQAGVYVYKSTDDLVMWEEIAKRFLKRRIKAVEQ